MSRIGKKTIPLPQGVEITAKDGQVTVKNGPKSTVIAINPRLKVETKDGHLHILRPDEERDTKAQHGLARSLINNAVTGVTQGFTKTLTIIGVGYRATQQGKGLQLQLGYSHPIDVPEIPGVDLVVETDNKAKTNFIHVKGIDKQKVGQVAANLRSYRPPEPYKGKGIRYIDETVQRKMGKAGKTGK